MISIFNNFKVSLKIWILAGIAVSGFAVIFITTLLTGAIEDSAREEAAAGAALGLAQARMEASSLMVRRREKDFFIRLDPKYIDSYNKDMTTTIAWLEKANATTDNSQVVIATSNLERILERHRDQFNKVADMWKRAGLTVDEGLYAEMQDAVHYVEDGLAEQNNNALTVKMLMMRRHEKDLMLRVATKDGNGAYSNGPKYAGRILDRQTEFNEILENSRISSDVKADLSDKLDAYISAFNKYAQIRMNLVTEIGILSDVYAETDEPFATLKKAANDINAAASEAAEGAASTAELSLMVVIIIFGSLSAITAILAIKTIVKPVADLEHALTEIAAGNYETDVPGTASQDELGSMARVVVDLRRCKRTY